MKGSLLLLGNHPLVMLSLAEYLQACGFSLLWPRTPEDYHTLSREEISATVTLLHPRFPLTLDALAEAEQAKIRQIFADEEIPLLALGNDACFNTPAQPMHKLAFPFSLQDVKSWLKQQTKRRTDHRIMITENLVYWPDDKCLKQGNPALSLPMTEREAELFQTLWAAEGEAVSRIALLENIWSLAAEKVETHTVETHIYRLRSKLAQLEKQPLLLVNTESGYCLLKRDSEKEG